MAAIKALQQWCKKQCEGYDNVEITNMTTSWRDGLAFCAILHHFRPDLLDFKSLKKEDVFENNKLAFCVAEEQLGIPALLDAEDMVALKVPDRLSILTYVSQYHNFFTGRSPIGGLAHIKRQASDSSDEPAQKKLTPEAKPKHLQSPRAPNSEPTPHPAPTCRVSAANKVPARDAGDTVTKCGTLSSCCDICKKTVLLVQRYLVDGKLYHRNCFRCTQCTNTLMPGAYKSGPTPGTFICINHSASTRERNRHDHSSSSMPLGSRPSHQPELSRATGPTAAVCRSLEPPRAAGSSVEGIRDAKPCLISSVTPERASPAGPQQSQDPVHRWRSPLERWKLGPLSPRIQEDDGEAVKSPVSTIGLSSNAERERARAILQKNLPFDGNNDNHNEGPSSSAEKSPGKQPTRYQTTASIALAISDSERRKGGARHSDHSKERELGQGKQDQYCKWRPVSNHESPPGAATGKGHAASKAASSASPNQASQASVGRAANMSEATRGRAAPAQKASSKGNFYSSQIITKAQEEELPSDWRSRLRPIHKDRRFERSDVEQIHSPSVNLDINTPEELNASGTPSSLKTPVSSLLIPIGTQGYTRTGGGNAIEVTFSPQTPGKVLISASPAFPNKGPRPEVGPSQPTQQKKVLKPGIQLLAESRDTFQSPSPADKEHRTASPFEKERNTQQTPGNDHHFALDRLTEELPGKRSWVQSKSSIATAREEFFKDIYDTGNDKKNEEPAKSAASPRAMRTGEESHDSLMEKTPSNRRMSEEEIQRELQQIGMELDALEQKGVDLEPQLRVCEGDEQEDELMVEWFKLIHEKQLLMRRESELVYISQQQILEDHQCQIDQELRALMAIAENQKTKADKAREQELMEELLKTVEDRNNIIDRLDEDRVREMEEDLMIEAMIKKIDINKEPEPYPKKKSKLIGGFNFMKRFGGKSK